MDNHTVYLMIGSLDIVRGGMTKALLNRANILANAYREVHILTFDFNPEYDLIRYQLYQMGKIKENIIIHNLYEYFANKKHTECCFLHPSSHDLQQHNQNKFEHYIKNDMFITKQKNSLGKLTQLFYQNKHLEIIKTELFDSQERLRMVNYYDVEKQERTEAFYINENGNCFLYKKKNPKAGTTNKVVTFNRSQLIGEEFPNETALRSYWVEEMVKNDKEPILISDSRSTDATLSAVKDDNVTKIIVIHSSHLDKPYTFDAPLVKKNKNALKNMNHFDAIVFLTEEQKKDVEKRFGHRSIFHAVPHSAEIQQNDQLKKEKDTAVVVSRFSSIKNIDHIIKAFKGVVSEHPNAKLELWGTGSQEKKYRELIDRLDLSNHVFLKGYTTNASEVLQKAAFSVLASKSEGFGLTLLESMAVGTPVISYDIKYGPRDMITDGKNGLLVKANDISQLTKAMNTLFKEKDKCKEMGRQAQKTVQEQFHNRHFLQKWLHVFQHATNQKQIRSIVSRTTCQVNDLYWVNKRKGILHLEGTVSFPAIVHNRDSLSFSLYMQKRKQQLDKYIPLEYKWINKHTMHFSGNIELKHFVHNEWIPKGIWDLYIHFSLSNRQKVVRLGMNEDKFASRLCTYIKNKTNTILPYFTIKHNLSLDVGEQLHKID